MNQPVTELHSDALVADPHKEYAVKDIYMAAYLLALGHKLDYARSDGYQAEFFFKNVPACLTGDSLIDCPRNLKEYPDGIPIKMLVGQELMVYGWSRKRNRLVLRQASNIRQTGQNAEVWQLTYEWTDVLGRSQIGSVKATPDHHILLQNGTYVKLSNLKVGEKLVPLTRWIDEWRSPYAVLCVDNMKRKILEHQFVDHGMHASNPAFHVHHVDHNSLNNTPSNLLRLPVHEHAKISSHHFWDNITLDTYVQFCVGQRKGRVNWFSKLPEGELLKFKALAGERLRELWKDPTFRMETIAMASDVQKRRWSNPAKHEENQDTIRKMHAGRDRRWQALSPEAQREHMEKMWAGAKKNHQVVKVEPIGREDVYDMEVDGVHNFVANGIVVHNSDFLCYYNGDVHPRLSARNLFDAFQNARRISRQIRMVPAPTAADDE